MSSGNIWKSKVRKRRHTPDLHTCEKAIKRKKIFADYAAVCGKRVQISGLPDGKTLRTITGKSHHETDIESQLLDRKE